MTRRLFLSLSALPFVRRFFKPKLSFAGPAQQKFFSERPMLWRTEQISIDEVRAMYPSTMTLSAEPHGPRLVRDGREIEIRESEELN